MRTDADSGWVVVDHEYEDADEAIAEFERSEAELDDEPEARVAEAEWEDVPEADYEALLDPEGEDVHDPVAELERRDSSLELEHAPADASDWERADEESPHLFEGESPKYANRAGPEFLVTFANGARPLARERPRSTPSADTSSPERQLVGIDFRYAVASPRDAFSGLPEGRVQHTAVTMTKRWGAASPQLLESLVANGRWGSVLFEFMRTDGNRKPYVHEIVKLTNATVSSMKRFVDRSQPPEQRDLEEISLVFEGIEISNARAKTSAEYSWNGRGNKRSRELETHEYPDGFAKADPQLPADRMAFLKQGWAGWVPALRRPAENKDALFNLCRDLGLHGAGEAPVAANVILGFLSGLRDENRLTDLGYFHRHSRMALAYNGVLEDGRLSRAPQWKWFRDDWIYLRNALVRPLLAATAPGAGAAGVPPPLPTWRWTDSWRPPTWSYPPGPP